MGSSGTLLIGLITLTYVLAALAYLGALVSKKEVFGPAGTLICFLAWLAHTAAIIWRWNESHQLGIGRAPLTNLYESLVFFGWAIAFMYLIMERIYKNRMTGAFILPLVVLVMVYAFTESKEIHPLIPALQSNWLVAHVVTSFFGYAGFSVSAGLSILLLITKDRAAVKGLAARLPEARVLDSLIYQNIAFGFIMLSAGIITGAIWAQSAWGTYWSWDPKETWSLITWLVYAAILHGRMVRGWAGKRVAILSLLGFGCVLFTYLGVNLVLSGLHSYAG
ncbi:MAG: c-type cytochrome biogenesis protein CcsB [Deltaproteobacteria bacterium]|nr:c-type cytochrome biogenesis protein CcsB [Deltaproteobacteria bacterium]